MNTAFNLPLIKVEGCGCASGGVVHIGDTYDTDVVGARSVGIRPALILRGHAQQHDDVDTVDGLEQALELVFQKAEINTERLDVDNYQ